MLIYLYGGSGSGKSAYAERRIVESGEKHRYYIATMERSGVESEKRIERHRLLRSGKGFQTIECPVGLEQLERMERGAVLIEDLSNLLANEIWSVQGSGFCQQLPELIADACRNLEKEHALVVVVGNDLYREPLPESLELEHYLRLLAECEQRLTAVASEVIEIVCGIPIVHKGRKEPR